MMHWQRSALHSVGLAMGQQHQQQSPRRSLSVAIDTIINGEQQRSTNAIRGCLLLRIGQCFNLQEIIASFCILLGMTRTIWCSSSSSAASASRVSSQAPHRGTAAAVAGGMNR